MNNSRFFLLNQFNFFNESRRVYFENANPEIPRPIGEKISKPKVASKAEELFKAEQIKTEQERQNAERMVFENDFNKKVRILKGKIDLLEERHLAMERDKQEGGIPEMLVGGINARALDEIKESQKEINANYLVLNEILKRTHYEKGQKDLRYLSDRLKSMSYYQHEGFYSILEDQASWEGMKERGSFLAAYAKGVAEGAISIIDPRTYIQLAEMIGEGAASLIYTNDNWAKIQKMIREAGNEWDRADANGKALMLGQFMGTLVGAKGLSIVSKAGKVKMLAKLEKSAKFSNLAKPVGKAFKLKSSATLEIADKKTVAATKAGEDLMKKEKPLDQKPKPVEKPLDASYSERTTVNGIDMSVAVGFDVDYFEIYFPQIESGSEIASAQGVMDQIIRISKNPTTAKKVFEYAASEAKTTPDVYKLYKKVEAYAREAEAAEPPPPPVEPKLKPADIAIDTSYIAVDTVNDMKISVGYDLIDENYTILFPQLNTDIARSKGISDSWIRISKNPATAKEVFEYAVKEAKTTPDIYKLYKKVRDYVWKEAA
jgi:hypothetical protein